MNVGMNAYAQKDISSRIINAKDIKSAHQVLNSILHPLETVNVSVVIQICIS